MAIVIPSNKIYELNNQKVVDNSIKNIEVTQNYDEVVIREGEEKLSHFLNLAPADEKAPILQKRGRGKSPAYKSLFSYGIQGELLYGWQLFDLPRYYRSSRVKDDVYITKIEPTIEAEFDLVISNVGCKSYIGRDPDLFNMFEFDDSETYNMRQTKSYNFDFDESKNALYNNGSIVASNAISISQNKITANFGLISSSYEEKGTDTLITVQTLNAIQSDMDILRAITVREDANSFHLDIMLAKEFTVWVASDYAPESYLNTPNSERKAEAQKYSFTLKNAKIVYNETIRRIEYGSEQATFTNENAIGDNTYLAETSRYVNTNATYDGVDNAPKILLENTLGLYEKGKETAIVRCSIGDYWDNNGNKAISVDTDSKMMFEHYDEVVPMFKNSLGMDEPISYDKNGLAKTFEVVGIRTIFDGAVWQELTLREKGSLSLKLTLPKPRLHLSGDILTVTDPSGLATQFRLYANGRIKGIYNLDKDKNTFNFILSMQNLNSGVNYLAVTSRAEDYNESPMSRTFAYYVKPKVEVVTEVNESGGLTYRITADEYKVVDGTYIIGD